MNGCPWYIPDSICDKVALECIRQTGPIMFFLLVLVVAMAMQKGK